jgi:hypothetical protein
LGKKEFGRIYTSSRDFVTTPIEPRRECLRLFRESHGAVRAYEGHTKRAIFPSFSSKSEIVEE